MQMGRAMFEMQMIVDKTEAFKPLPPYQLPVRVLRSGIPDVL